MKRIIFFCMLAVSSCQILGSPDDSEMKGELRISFADEQATRVTESIPDTSDFLITVYGPDG